MISDAVYEQLQAQLDDALARTAEAEAAADDAAATRENWAHDLSAYERDRADAALARVAMLEQAYRELYEAAFYFEDDLSDFCDGPLRDRLNAALAAAVLGDPK